MKQSHLIQQFTFREKYISIDWDILKQSIKISIPYGIVNIYIESNDPLKYGLGMWFALLPTKIDKFTFQKNDIEETGDIFLITNDQKISLGMTHELESAQKWISIANQVIEKAKLNLSN